MTPCYLRDSVGAPYSIGTGRKNGTKNFCTPSLCAALQGSNRYRAKSISHGTIAEQHWKSIDLEGCLIAAHVLIMFVFPTRAQNLVIVADQYLCPGLVHAGMTKIRMGNQVVTLLGRKYGDIMVD